MHKILTQTSFIIATLVIFNSIAMESKKCDIMFWIPENKPAVYLNVRRHSNQAFIITNISQHGENSDLVKHFSYAYDRSKNQVTAQLDTLCGQTRAEQELLRTALIYAESKGKVKMGFQRERENAAGTHCAKFIASIVFVAPDAFQIKIRPEKRKEQ